MISMVLRRLKMDKNPTKYYSNIQENRIASYLGWKVVSGSGSRNCRPGDVVSARWLGECKTHTSSGKKIYFGKDIWRKISSEASAQFKNPCLFSDDGSQNTSRTWVMIPSACVSYQNINRVSFECENKSSFSFKHEAAELLEKHFNDKPTVLFPYGVSNICILRLSTFNSMFGELK